MRVYGQLLKYIKHIRYEVVIKVLLGMANSATYIVQAILMGKNDRHRLPPRACSRPHLENRRRPADDPDPRTSDKRSGSL